MDLMGALSPGATVVDFGSGYGGAARRLAKELGVRVEAINISAVENSRHRQLNESAKLQDLIRVHDASFEDVPLAASCADVVWSQDAILHSGNRQQVLQEAARLLKPGGVFVLTDPMAADGIDPASLSAILERIHLPDMGSPDRYRAWASQAGLSRDVWQEKTDMLIRHYSRVLEELQCREQELKTKISPDYLQRMAAGLGHWIDGGQQGRLSWGLMRFRKPLE
jgi:dimethylglycine N-methyltransferase